MSHQNGKKPVRPPSKREPAAAPRIRVLSVTKALGEPWRGRMRVGGTYLTCALGRTGIRSSKREGDNATPAGQFRLTCALARLDRQTRPRANIPLKPIHADCGWCDDVTAPLYNRPVRLPHEHRHERLYRADHVYDILIVIDYNQRPRQRGRGSAIFFHLARPGYAGTEGCVAISAMDMRRLLPRLSRHTRIVIR